MAKKVFFDKDARERSLKGAKQYHDLIKVSFGPQGGDVGISRQFGAPLYTHDGAMISAALDLPDVDDETLGSRFGAAGIQDATDKLTRAAGNGRTSAVLMTYFIEEATHKLAEKKLSKRGVRLGIESAGRDALKALEPLNEVIDGNKKRVKQVATVAANGDTEVGDMVAKIYNELGKDGVVTVQPGQSLDLEPTIVKGYTFDRGWLSPYFMNDPGEQTAKYDSPVFVITAKQLVTAADVVPLLEGMKNAKISNVVFIADDIQGEALNVLIVNKLKRAMNIVAVKAPSFGDRRLAMLEDIATLVGATVIPESANIEDVALEHLGQAKHIIVDKDETTIIKGAGKEKDLAEHVKSIRDLAAEQKDDFEKKQLNKRAAALEGKVAIIRVGGATESEIDRRKSSVEDSVASTRAALQEGVVPGGAVTLIALSKAIEVGDYQNDPVQAGRKLVKDALLYPFEALVGNAGFDGKDLLDQLNKHPVGHGVDLEYLEPKIVDLKAAGVVDATRVVREVVRISVSLAATHATLGALMVEIPEKVDPAEAAGMGY